MRMPRHRLADSTDTKEQYSLLFGFAEEVASGLRPSALVSAKKFQPKPAPLARARSIRKQIKFGGPYRVRTGDLLHAMQALYQLS